MCRLPSSCSAHYQLASTDLAGHFFPSSPFSALHFLTFSTTTNNDDDIILSSLSWQSVTFFCCFIVSLIHIPSLARRYYFAWCPLPHFAAFFVCIFFPTHLPSSTTFHFQPHIKASRHHTNTTPLRHAKIGLSQSGRWAEPPIITSEWICWLAFRRLLTHTHSTHENGLVDDVMMTDDWLTSPSFPIHNNSIPSSSSSSAKP